MSSKFYVTALLAVLLCNIGRGISRSSGSPTRTPWTSTARTALDLGEGEEDIGEEGEEGEEGVGESDS